MIRTALVALLALSSLSPAWAQQPPPATERRTINPVAVQGSWLGTPGAMPTDCKGDGFVILFGTNNGQTFQMSVQQRVGGTSSQLPTETLLKVVPPPDGAPLRVDVFLQGGKTELGIAILTGSKMELIPAGADKTYGQTSLHLMRC